MLCMSVDGILRWMRRVDLKFFPPKLRMLCYNVTLVDRGARWLGPLALLNDYSLERGGDEGRGWIGNIL